MSSIVVVFPKKENATNIRNILVRNGFSVMAVCTTGAQAIQYADDLDDGIIVCGYKLSDMLYTELREYLPETFEMLLVASPVTMTTLSLYSIYFFFCVHCLDDLMCYYYRWVL